MKIMKKYILVFSAVVIGFGFPAIVLAGGPVPGLDITIESNPGGTAKTTQTDANGNYVFDKLAPGAYLLRIGSLGPQKAENYNSSKSNTSTAIALPGGGTEQAVNIEVSDTVIPGKDPGIALTVETPGPGRILGNVTIENPGRLPSAGLTPESPFYFLDKFGEALQEFFTFNPEAKARLQITFAAERVAEIKIVLETKGVDAKGLEVAQSRLQAHLASAANIIADQKAQGKNVSRLAKELDDEFEAPKTVLKQTFKNEKRALEVKEDELKAKIKEARQAGDTAQVEVLVKELGDVKAQKELLELKKDEQEEALEKEEERLKEELEAKEKAEKAMRGAEKEKQEVIDEAVDDGVTVPAGAFEKFDKLLAQAKELFARGNYQGAKQLAKQAEKSLDAVEDAINDLEEAKEEEEKLKEEREEQKEKEREAIEKQSEKIRKDVKKEAERVEKDVKKAGEETKKSDERLRKESEKLNEEQNKENKETSLPLKPETPVATIPVAQKWNVEIRGGRFAPSELKIKKGDTVTWTNRDSSQTWPASAIHPTHQAYPGFDALRGLNTGESYSFKFDKVGNWKYHDHLNPSVTGVIEVE